MTTDHATAPSLTTGGKDADLTARLDKELDAFNEGPTGAAPQSSLSVRVDNAAGELIGGLAGWTWGGLCGIEMLWVREDSRTDGWGSRILLAAEAEARQRGCDRAIVSSFTFQAPAFYQRHGYIETGRTPGIPGGHEDVHMFKILAPPASTPAG
ncbi:GNAT family N-acetyltransferase [Streptomyces sp. H27-C3]|uniref:GNAT family N-acetyltransferase n=1 Tax=Streptomyces sp. H27-C3 TaxID=3046305 RepID=UPI0024B88763|nr:GNAT family N-acetyltransferase [Streptomyces sp. H27-C3]MDJ0465398.1 GNAT family N-acetyltransferase [Streptomyces sp. H27-C3]